MKEIEEKRLPARKVGTRRRVMFGDLMNYKQRSDAGRQQALEKLAAIDEALGLRSATQGGEPDHPSPYPAPG